MQRAHEQNNLLITKSCHPKCGHMVEWVSSTPQTHSQSTESHPAPARRLCPLSQLRSASLSQTVLLSDSPSTRLSPLQGFLFFHHRQSPELQNAFPQSLTGRCPSHSLQRQNFISRVTTTTAKMMTLTPGSSFCFSP